MIESFIVVFIGAFIASSVGALLGIGGGIIMVPIFVIFAHIPIQMAVAVSLFVIVSTSLLVSAKHIQSNALNLKLGVMLELVTTLGAIAGSLFALRLPHRLLVVLFGVFLIFISFSMFRKNRDVEQTEDGKFSYFDEKLKKNVRYDVKNLPFAFPLSFIAGITSGLFGIGGGVLKVPLLVKVCKIPVKVATATSSFMVGITAAAAVFIYFKGGFLRPDYAFLGLFGSFFGSRIGIKIHSAVNEDTLRVIFAVSLIVVAIVMVLK
ncbi:sulfite exporter TauE/SafE family protein [Hippea jasoniae]|uniref:sulfite exporter TauE/SafE family protein n=1 Tax=Hippea jasoniae TaxID=944479 RepID=UPI0005527EA5|nr:sulfite exporter TauE/SafE family protein [Hippea jasoniae]